MGVADDLVDRHEQLKDKRSTWEAHWDEIARLVLPRYADFSGAREKGGKRTEEIFDPSGMVGLDRFAAGMESLLVPRNSRWHGLKVLPPELNDENDVKAWMDLAVRMLFERRYAPNANFAGQMHEYFLGQGGFGTGTVFIEETPAGPHYQMIPLRESFLDENHRGVVDVLERHYRMTARQCVQAFQDGELSDDIKKAAAKEPNKEFEILHVVRPREEREHGKADKGNLPWASYYVEVEGRSLIEEGGFEEFPYAVGR